MPDPPFLPLKLKFTAKAPVIRFLELAQDGKSLAEMLGELGYKGGGGRPRRRLKEFLLETGQQVPDGRKKKRRR